METRKAKKDFPNYTELNPLLPGWLWQVIRLSVLLLVAFVIYTLFEQPEQGLILFWKLLIPLLPLSFAVVPGLWRNICPMAYLNQLPRLLGIGLQRTLSEQSKKYALLISIVAFVVFVVLRAPLLNHSGVAVGVMLISVLLLALLGGLIFKGRSGWCGTFCPLAPLQKIYGHAPLLMVRNGYCEPCVGCQRNCYDFNPKAAIFSDLSDPDPWWSDKRKYFAAMLPGLIIGFFTASEPTSLYDLDYYLGMITPPLITIGVYFTLSNLFRLSDYKQVALFGLGALSIFYWYGSPVLLSGVAEVFSITLPGFLIVLMRIAIIVILLLVLVRGLLSERAHQRVILATNTATVGSGVTALRAALDGSSNNPEVLDRSSGKHFEVRPEQTLLDAIEAAELPIMSGCRMGMCGSDPVVIVDGAENLAPPDQNELTTLKRLGLSGKARLACCCKPAGNMTIDLDASHDEMSIEQESSEKSIDNTDNKEQLKIVIIGNGISGISTAESLRELEVDCSISLVSKEPHHFYNRMGLEQVIYGRTAMHGLYLMQEEWYQRNAIQVWLNTQAESIDRENKQVLLGTGEKLDYDKLVLATGGNAFVPPIPGFDLEGCFAFRDAEDAITIRSWIQEHKCKRSIVLGGGVLGVEAAHALHKLGQKVSIIHHSDRLMNMQLDTTAANMLKKFLENGGMNILTETSIESAEGEQLIEQVKLSNHKSLPADLLLICTGIRADTGLAQTADLKLNRGVLVDENMMTSDENIYCVGDAAEYPGTTSGLWAVGSEQGKVAAAHMHGKNRPYADVIIPPMQLKVEGIDLKSFGLINDKDATSYTDGDVTGHKWINIYVKDKKIVGGIFINAPLAAKAAMTFMKKANDQISVDDIHSIFEK